MDARDEDGLITVAIVWQQPELHALLGLLDAHGIFASTVGAGHVSVEPTLAIVLGGIQVRVPAEDATRACELLAAIDPVGYRGPLFSRNCLINIAAALLMLITFVPAPARLPALRLDAARLQTGGLRP